MTFDQAVKIIIEKEGGYVNNPNDSGGETKYGISKRSYPHLNIKDLTVEDAKQIYLRDYWQVVQADALPQKLRLTVFDFAVKAGAKTSIKTLQFTAGVKKDGVIGNNTLRGSQKVEPRDFAVARIRHYTGLVRDRPKDMEFLNGWLIRTLDITLLSE